MFFSSLLLVALAATSLPFTNARAVFCHYLVGGLDGTDHATQDIVDAKNAGFDAFALNINSPTASWATKAISFLFEAAQAEGISLFFSMDTTGGWQFSDWDSLMDTYLQNPAYYKGPNGLPMLSTFDDGPFQPSDWQNFRNQYDVYFVPDFDDTDNFYSDITHWLGTWGGVVDGLYTWETAWPGSSNTPQRVSTDSDRYIMMGTSANGKTYMAPLSSLQFKDLPSLGANYYRKGEVCLPQRMEEILALGQSSNPNTIAPDFVEVISWNDVGESHYIGNIWDESQPADAYKYGNSTNWSHAAWQPLITSFINTYKAGGDASNMAPPGGNPIGTMWYRTILKNAACANDPLGKPAAWESAEDAVNWAVVLPQGADGYTVTVSSGGNLIQSGIHVSAGLNYDSTPGLMTGPQQVQLLDGGGNVVLTGSSTIDVAADTDGVCNFNYQVAGMSHGRKQW